jgi:hypothetical protein
MAKIVEIEKIWQGKYASLRDYWVREALNKGEDMVVKFGNRYMRILHKDLSKPVATTPEFKSKVGEKNYSLWDYEWKPDEQATDKA